MNSEHSISRRERLIRALQAPYVLTDSSLSPGRSHIDIARAALAGGAGVIQLRDKGLSAESQAPIAREIACMARAAGGILIVNDHVDVVRDSGADGVHLGRSDMAIGAARDRLGPETLIGASASSVDEAVAAKRDGADYIGLGPIFSTSSKPDAGAPAGVQLIAEVRRAVRIPIVAIGGLTADNIGEVLRAGADGAAFISAVVSADDPEAATRRLASAMADTHKEQQ